MRVEGNTSYDVCAKCKRKHKVRRDGTIGRHLTPNSQLVPGMWWVCEGTGKKPYRPRKREVS